MKQTKEGQIFTDLRPRPTLKIYHDDFSLHAKVPKVTGGDGQDVGATFLSKKVSGGRFMPFKKKDSVVITYGTYDLLHIGHIKMLKRCRALGDKLIVALSTDEFNWRMKQKVCIQTYSERREILMAIRYVDLVIPEESWEQKINDVKKYKAAVFAIGDDWAGKFDFLKEHCEVIYLPRTEGISTTIRKKQIVQTFNK